MKIPMSLRSCPGEYVILRDLLIAEVREGFDEVRSVRVDQRHAAFQKMLKPIYLMNGVRRLARSRVPRVAFHG
jgi:hypothetical protein